MIEDPIVEEIRRHRREHALENDDDLGWIVESLRKREEESPRKVLNPGPKYRIRKTGS